MARQHRKKPVYRSGFEDKVLAVLRDEGIPFQYESMKLTYVLPSRKYTPDIILENGIIIELKGYFRSSDRTKMRHVVKQYPLLDIRIVFQRAGEPITKKSKTSYGEWCTKNGIKWAEGSIPRSWIDEVTDSDIQKG